MITLSLVFVIAHLVFTGSSFINRFIVCSEAEKLVATCRYLRQRAMSANTLQKLVFDVDQNAYFYQTDHERTATKLSSRVRFGVGSATVLGPPSAPTTVITESVTYQHHEILFYPDGIISAGLVYLSDTSGKYIYALSSPVSEVSFLRTYVYDGTWKLLK